MYIKKFNRNLEYKKKENLFEYLNISVSGFPLYTQIVKYLYKHSCDHLFIIFFFNAVCIHFISKPVTVTNF